MSDKRILVVDAAEHAFKKVARWKRDRRSGVGQQMTNFETRKARG